MGISIKGLNKAEVLAALYNAARPQGMGFMQYKPEPMTIQEAQSLLDQRPPYFDYLKGRVMKISLATEEIDPSGYERDNGLGNVDLIIKSLRAGFGPDNEITREIHAGGTEAAAKLAKRSMEKENNFVVKGGVAILEMGLSDMKDKLGPAVDQALKGKK